MLLSSRKPNLFQKGMFNFIVISICAVVIHELCDVYLCIFSQNDAQLPLKHSSSSIPANKLKDVSNTPTVPFLITL